MKFSCDPQGNALLPENDPLKPIQILKMNPQQNVAPPQVVIDQPPNLGTQAQYVASSRLDSWTSRLFERTSGLIALM